MPFIVTSLFPTYIIRTYICSFYFRTVFNTCKSFWCKKWIIGYFYSMGADSCCCCWCTRHIFSNDMIISFILCLTKCLKYFIFFFVMARRPKETENFPQTPCNDANWYNMLIAMSWGDWAAADSSVVKSVKRG